MKKTERGVVYVLTNLTAGLKYRSGQVAGQVAGRRSGQVRSQVRSGQVAGQVAGQVRLIGRIFLC